MLGKRDIDGSSIENRKNKNFRCSGSMKLVATGIENKKNKRIRCLGIMKLMVRASRMKEKRVSDAWEA